VTVDHSFATWQKSIGEDSACIEPARNPLARLSDMSQDTACIQAAHNPLGRQHDSASWGKVLWSLING
jgi:hypothetical protein